MEHRPTEIRRQLNWFDSTSVIVGTIIGAGIYQTASPVAGSVSSVWMFFALWLIGGLFSLCGAMCYAELASAFPHTGGDYVYLNKAYGSWAGFLFGWLQMLVIRPGDIAIIAFIFATYLQEMLQRTGWISSEWAPAYASAAVAILTVINILGIRQSKWVQNFLTSLKVLGLLAIVGLAFATPTDQVVPVEKHMAASSVPIGVALILVLFTYGGWNEMAYLAAEVKRPERTMVRSLISGTAIVTLLYLLINGAFLRVLGLEGMSQSTAIATDTVDALLPKFGGVLVSLLICVSTLGTVNGMVLTGSRISYALGVDHPLFRKLGDWDARTGTPVFALVVQGVITIILILLLGTFTAAILYTSAAVYTFYLATACAVVVLRRKLPDIERPYRVTAFPLPILFFGVACIYLIYSAVCYNPTMARAVIVLALVGFEVYFYEQRTQSRR